MLHHPFSTFFGDLMKTATRKNIVLSIPVRFGMALLLLAGMLASVLPNPANAAGIVTVRYAKETASGLGNCKTWVNACTLETALSVAASGTEIWVTEGTHRPTTGTDRNATFQLKSGVAVYGGFYGDESNLGDRYPIMFITILSGDIGTLNDSNDNSYHVVTGATGAILDGVTISGGRTEIGVGTGGGMLNINSNPTLNDVIFSGNWGYKGGGMYNEGSSPTLSNVTFSGNSAIYGGGIYNNGGSPTLSNVTFSSNGAIVGGGMTNENGTAVTLNNAIFSSNTSTSDGGGISNRSGSLTVTNATFNANSSPQGGGLAIEGGPVGLTNVTFTMNTASSSGGGVNNFSGNATFTNVTFLSNTAPQGGGFYNSSGSPTLRNSIVWGNSGGQISGAATVSDSVVQGGYTGTNVLTGDPLLGILGDYTGFTQTIPLLPGSSAIDAGNNTVCAALSGGNKDQRGKSRVGACDIGAFESQGFTLNSLTGTPQSAQTNTAFATPPGLTVSSASGEPVDGGKITFTAPVSGASANISGSPATISLGRASVSATANNTPGGPYMVSANASGVSAAANFSLTNLPSTNANLSNLVLSTGALTPTFATGTTSYTQSVSNATTSLTVTPTVADANATVKVNGTTVASGSASGAIALNVGANTITTVVTAQDGTTTRTYTVTVTRAASSNANLSNLVLSTGALTPAFAAGTTIYSQSVSNATASLTVTPTVADATATVKVNGKTIAPGNTSSPIVLNIGENVITTVVTAQDSSTKTYMVVVTRAGSDNAGLSNLVLSTGALDPVFATGTTIYTQWLGNAITSLTVTPTVAEPNATVTVNGSPVTSGSASGSIALNVGENIIATVVTAQDGITTLTYTVTVIRVASSNANLSNLVLSTGALTPVFAAGTTSYTQSVANNVTSLTVTPTVADSTARVKVNGVPVASGATSAPIALNVGANTITTLVNAQAGGVSRTYTVTVTRAASSNANLSNLVLSSGALTPAFAAGTTSYTQSVANATTSLTVTPTVADAAATVKVNGSPVASGSASASIALSVGANTITTVVTPQDGSTTRTYTVTVTRAKSSNANLSNLVLSSGTLTPTFATGTTSYTQSVGNTTTSLTVTPTVADATATVKVNGSTVASGSASGSIALSIGANTITTVVTAQDNSTKTYTVTVTRQITSANADLSNLVLSSGALNPAFTAEITSYTQSVSNATTSLTVTPTVASAAATVKVNGNTVASGSASTPIALNPGANILTVVVTAQDGSTQTYTVTITRKYAFFVPTVKR
jgi:hypothetical protein